MKFRLKKNCGSHVEGGKIYKAGDIIETDNDLAAIFHGKDANGNNRPGKFELIHDESLKDTGKEDTTRVRPDIAPPAANEYGKDVSSEFPTADKVDVLVFEKSKWYTVVDKADGEVLSEKRLRRKDVEPFLEQYLNENTDED